MKYMPARPAIGPVLVHAVPGVLPVIEHVTADLVATGAAHMSVALRLQMVMADRQVVDVLDFEGYLWLG